MAAINITAAALPVVLSDTTGAASGAQGYVWDPIGLAWQRMQQPILNAGTVVIPGTVTVSGTVAFSNTTIAVTNVGTFAVQATLAAETTKVIGTVNVAAAQTLATVTTVGTVTTVSTVTAVTAITNALPVGANVIGKVSIDQATPGTTNLVALSAETTKVIGTVNQGTSPWVANATLSAETTKVIGTVNQGTSPWVANATLSAETTKVIGTINVASGQTVALAAGSQAIGTVSIAAAQTIAVTNAGTFAVQLATNTPTETRPASPTVARVDYTTVSDTTRALTALAANASRRGATVKNNTNTALRINEGGTASLTSYTDIIQPGASYVLAYPACTSLLSVYLPSIPVGDILVTERV